MQKLSDDILARLDMKEAPLIRVMPNGHAILFEGCSGRFLNEAGLLNFIVQHNDRSSYSIRIKDLEESGIPVKYMPGLKPNTSSVVAVGMEDGMLYAQHWDGFCSYFEPKNLKLLSQKFTK